jgi:hypothetical protein
LYWASAAFNRVVAGPRFDAASTASAWREDSSTTLATASGLVPLNDTSTTLLVPSCDDVKPSRMVLLESPVFVETASATLGDVSAPWKFETNWLTALTCDPTTCGWGMTTVATA